MDERAYEMDQVIADVLRREPEKLKLVVEWIERFLADPDFSIHSKDDLTEWLDLIQAPRRDHEHLLRGVVGVRLGDAEPAQRAPDELVVLLDQRAQPRLALGSRIGGRLARPFRREANPGSRQGWR